MNLEDLGVFIASKTTSLIMQSKLFSSLDIKPLKEAFDGKYLHKICQRSCSTIKIFIMDISRIIKINHIYT